MPHICLKCNGNFRTKQHLDRHLDKIRPCDQKSNTCPHCNITFSNKKNYTYHMDHTVCIRKPEQIINNETADLDISRNQDIDLEREKIILEREKIALRRMELLVELKKMGESKTTGDININIDKAVINILSIGNENLDPLNFDNITRITRKKREGFTDYCRIQNQ